MILLAALCAALSAFLLWATATGHGDRLALRLPHRRRDHLPRAVWLRQAGAGVTPAQFWAVSAGAGLLAEMICWVLSGSAYVGLALAGSAALAPRAYFGRRRAAHLRAVVDSWPDGVRHLLASVGARLSVHQALLELTHGGPAPLRIAFARYRDLSQLLGTVGALEVIRDQIADPDTDRIIEFLIVAYETGGDLTLLILQDLAEAVVDDLRVAAEVRAAHMEPRLTAKVAFILPYVALVLLCVMVVGFREFYRLAAGAFFVVVAAAMSSAGLLLSRRFSREAPEIRVLGGRS